MTKCKCSLVRELFTNPDEEISFGHIQQAKERGVPQECINYLFDNIEKIAREAFPECFPPCPCDLVRDIIGPDTEISFGHVQQAKERGASETCIEYLFDKIGVKGKEAFPECFGKSPIITILSPQSGQILTTTKSVLQTLIKYKAEDDIGLEKVEIYCDGKSKGEQVVSGKSVTSSVSLNVGVGEHTVRLIAYDVEGQTGEASVTFTVVKQAPPPTEEVPPSLPEEGITIPPSEEQPSLPPEEKEEVPTPPEVVPPEEIPTVPPGPLALTIELSQRGLRRVYVRIDKNGKKLTEKILVKRGDTLVLETSIGDRLTIQLKLVPGIFGTKKEITIREGLHEMIRLGPTKIDIYTGMFTKSTAKVVTKQKRRKLRGL